MQSSSHPDQVDGGDSGQGMEVGGSGGVTPPDYFKTTEKTSSGRIQANSALAVTAAAPVIAGNNTPWLCGSGGTAGRFADQAAAEIRCNSS